MSKKIRGEMMGLKKFFGCYQLPVPYQNELFKKEDDCFWYMRHDGDWLHPNFLKNYDNCKAVMKCYLLAWDTSLPRIIEAMKDYHIMIRPIMNYMEVRFHNK